MNGIDKKKKEIISRNCTMGGRDKGEGDAGACRIATGYQDMTYYIGIPEVGTKRSGGETEGLGKNAHGPAALKVSHRA